MSDFDKNMRDALEGEGGFDPDRAGSAQTEVFHFYEKKMAWSERVMWLQMYLLIAAGAYAVGGFMVQATTTKGWIGYGLVIILAFVIIIQKTILHGISATQIVAMKEIKQLRLAVAGGAIPQDKAATRPLRGIKQWERSAWLGGMIAIGVIAALLGSMSDRQDDLWKLKAGGQFEARSVLSLRRFPHRIPSFYDLEPPVQGGELQSVTLNGEPVSFKNYGSDGTHYTIVLPGRLSWGRDKIELVWKFTIPVEKIQNFMAPLRAMMPVHGYALTLDVEDDSGFAVKGDSWKFNKKPAELKNEAEARRTVKLFTIGGSVEPRDNFGTCGLPIVAR